MMRPVDTKSLPALIDEMSAGGDVRSFGALGRPLLRGYAEAAYAGQSIDAAYALHRELLPGWQFAVSSGPICYAAVESPAGVSFEASADTPARAAVAAVLRAAGFVTGAG
jgi:hypothetical protein